jgi:exonuclease SbcD
MAQLRRRFPHVLSLVPPNPGQLKQPGENPTYTQRLRGRNDLDIACDFVTKVRGDAPTPAEHALLRQAVEHAQHTAHEETV